MILYTTKWTSLNLSCDLLCEIAHDAVLLVEFAYQDSEVKLRLNSSKYFYNGELRLAPQNGVLPYCLHIKGIESMRIACGGHPELYITQLERTATDLHIVGANGEMSFSGQKLDVAFLLDGQSFAAVQALEQ